MLSFYSVVLDYFRRSFCYYRNDVNYCLPHLSTDDKDLGVGMTSFLLLMVTCELVCSIISVALAGKAYPKCCNTYDVNDCGTCIGCCECDTTPLYGEQVNYYGFYRNPSNMLTSVSIANEIMV